MERPIPLVSVIGRSGTGKTTLIEKLIPELARRGWRVATIKHNRHGFEVDHEGKDSWRHRRAGAVATLVACPQYVALIEDTAEDYGIGELRDRYLRNCDLVLAEGFKQNPFPKIEVYRAALGQDLLSAGDDSLLAVASDTPLPGNIPCRDLNDTAGLADLIESRVLGRVKP